jgi:hypothetical protein
LAKTNSQASTTLNPIKTQAFCVPPNLGDSQSNQNLGFVVPCFFT